MTPLVIVLAGSAVAEDKYDLGAEQRLRPDTDVKVDIYDPASELIFYLAQTDDGSGGLMGVSVTLVDPVGNDLGTFPSGSNLVPTGGPGAYTLAIDTTIDLDSNGEPDPLEEWEFTVTNAGSPVPGRIWSKRWRIDAENFDAAFAMDGSFYAIVGGGAVGVEGVVEFKADGLAGFKYSLLANSEGIIDGDGRSRYIGAGNPEGWAAGSEHPLYLAPPDPQSASFTWIQPVVTNESLVPESSYCDAILPGIPGGGATLSFESNVAGVAHLLCDLDDDGVFDITSDADLHLLSDIASGATVVLWDGNDNLEIAVPTGTYDCILKVTVGEFHFVANDIETSYEGFRVFEVEADADRRGLAMYWNDAEVQAYDTDPMPNLQYGLETSGPFGIPSGTYASPAVPNVNARSWGSFQQSSKGNEALLDTYTWLAEDQGGPFTIDVFDVVADADSDGLPDSEEGCVSFTDPFDPDSDADGAGDFVEVRASASDPNDPDSDDDGLLDGEEFADPDTVRDSDGDGLEDTVDPDDDDDLVGTAIEGDADADADGTPNHLDPDDDDDGVLTEDEDWDSSGDWTDDDLDGDGIWDFLDTDEDGDGVEEESTTEDFDGDGAPDFRDPDDDGDGVPTGVEYDVDGDGLPDDTDGDGDPNQFDTDDDDDGLATSVESDPDADGVSDDGAADTDEDGTPDFLDPDADGDTVPDAVDGTADVDQDGAVGFQDPDDDGDGLDTILEDPNGDGDPTTDDTDDDGLDDYLDADDDDDTVPTIEEYDRDGDGVPDDTDDDGTPNYLDPDDDGDGIPTSVEGDIDTDGDGIPDYIDTDSDNDTIWDEEEGRNPTDDADGDFLPDFQDPDDDGDGVSTYDELGYTEEGEVGPAEEPRVDSDADGDPDYLDPDDDDDGIPTELEGDFGDDMDDDGTPNHLDLDSDGDGISDEREGADDIDTDGSGSFLDLDADGDGYADDFETTVDSDGDGQGDWVDEDDDGDTVPTVEEVNGDTDEDGVSDRLDPDDDGDGIPTKTERQDGLTHGNDVDGEEDDLPPWIDTDSDGDGVSDRKEGRKDVDGDGVPNYLDPDGAYVSWYRGSGLSVACSGTGSGPVGWLAVVLVALLARRAEASADGPEISHSRGRKGGVVVLAPRVVPATQDPAVADLAARLQARIRDAAVQARGPALVDGRPSPERVCPQAGCRADSIGLLLGHQDGGCVAVAIVGPPGAVDQRLVPLAGEVALAGDVLPFRAAPEGRLVVREFVPCAGLEGAISPEAIAGLVPSVGAPPE